jgi:hypothetical protein
MAKEQGLALNPTTISGQCGRLLCCLGYEFETYSELKKGMPKCGKKILWQNRECEVTSQDILRQQVTLRDREGSCCCVTMEELRTGQSSQPTAQEKPSGEMHTNRLSRQKPQRQELVKPAGKVQKTVENPMAKKPATSEDQDVKLEDKTPSETTENQTQSKRRRRGRRRPRNGRKPGPNKQGE